MLLGSKTFGDSSIERVNPLLSNGAIRLTTARFMTPTGRETQGRGLKPDLAAVPMRLKKLMHGEWRHEVDMRGALKNTDPVAPDNTSAAVAASGVTASTVMSEASSVTTSSIGRSGDEQLSQAADAGWP